MKLLEVGDKVRVFSKEKIDALNEVGGRTLCLRGTASLLPVGEIRTITYVDADDDCFLEDAGGYIYPSEILELV